MPYRYRFLAVLAVLGLLALYGPAGAVLNGLVAGLVDVKMVEADGTVRQAAFGPHAPYPAWLSLPPGAAILSGGAFEPTPQHGAGGALDLAVEGDGAAMLAAWESRLAAAGFTVRRTANPADTLFDIEATLEAEHPAAGRRLRLLLRRAGLGSLAQLSYWEPTPPAP
ncbi:MAG: hypothetical protein AB7S71_19950 [Dongiaceae bacterium]